MQRSILRTVTLLLLTVMSSRISLGQTYNGGEHYLNINTSRASDDSPEITTVIYKDGGPLYVVQMREDKVLTMSIDGKAVPADSIGRYQSVIDKIRDRIKEAKEQAKRDRAQAERDREQAGRDREQAERDRAQAELDRKQADRNRLQAERDRESQIGEREQADRDRQQADKDRVQAERDRQQANLDRDQAGRDREQAERDREQAVRDRAQAERDRIRAEEDRKLMDSIMNDLISDKVAPDKESIHSLRIEDDEIRVNGKRLPEALEKKYLSKYGKRGFSMSYHNND